MEGVDVNLSRLLTVNVYVKARSVYGLDTHRTT